MLARDPQGEPAFVIPGLRFGNVFVGPQPLRSTFARAMDTSHDTITPPPHSYLAAYLWYRHAFGADAVVHVGRHGTLEWLPGKQVGQAGDDSAEVLLGDLPNAYVYIQDGGGEAIQAKRRSAAVLVSHLSPLLASAGQPPVLAQLDEAIEQAEATRQLARAFRAVPAAGHRPDARAEARPATGSGCQARRGRRSSRSCTPSCTRWRPSRCRWASTRSARCRPRPIRWTRWRCCFRPSSAILPMTATCTRGPRIWSPAARPRWPGWPTIRCRQVRAALQLARQWLADLRALAPAELDGLITVLAGRYLPTGPLGDPVRTPDGLPTAATCMPSMARRSPRRRRGRSARPWPRRRWRAIGREAGRLPESVSMVLWYGETERHQGAMEAEALWLDGRGAGVERARRRGGRTLDSRCRTGPATRERAADRFRASTATGLATRWRCWTRPRGWPPLPATTPSAATTARWPPRWPPAAPIRTPPASWPGPVYSRPSPATTPSACSRWWSRAAMRRPARTPSRGSTCAT